MLSRREGSNVASGSAKLGEPRTTGTRCRSFSFAKAVQVKLKNGGATL